MAMDNRLHVRAQPINLCMDKTLEIDRPPAGINRRSVQGELDDILGRTVPGAMLRASRNRSGSLS